MSVTRYELTVHVETVSALHSGGLDEVVDRDATTFTPQRFARDGNGMPVLTGRSVKGAVRAACAPYMQHEGDDDAGQLAGRHPAALWGGVADGASRAGTLTFHTVSLSEAVGDDPLRGGGAGLATRTGIAVDRYWGSAGDTALFAHEYVPAGTRLPLTITAQAGRMPSSRPGEFTEAPTFEPATEEQVEGLLALIIALLRCEQVSFGGRRNAGWGRVRLARMDRPWILTKSSLSSRQGLLGWLDGGEDISDTIPQVHCTAPERVSISIGWDSPTGILVAEPQPDAKETDAPQPDGAPRAAEAAPAQHPERAQETGESAEEQPKTSAPAKPLRAGPGDNDPLVLPGSSVRGALRSRASRIARTVLASRQGEAIGDWSGRDVHRQLAEDPTLVRDLFGSTEHRGALTVLDTLASTGTSRIVTHNAGDRWTGGVAGGVLYSEEVHDVAWDSLILELDLGRLPQDKDRRRAAWCLLGLTLAEFAAGALPLGSRGTRGLGQIRVRSLEVSGGADTVGGPWRISDSPEAAAESVASQLLDRLRGIEITPNPQAGGDWTGWSSYLCENESGRHHD